MHPEYSHHLSGWRFKALVLVVILSALGYLLFMLWGGWDDVIAALVRVGYGGLAAALAFSLLNYGLRFIRWQYYLAILGYRVPPWESFKIYIAGFALTATPAKAGEMLRSIFLKDYGVSYHASFGAFLSERVSDLIAILLLAAIGIWEYPAARPICLSIGIVILFVLFALQKKSWTSFLHRWAYRNLSRRASRSILFFIKILNAFRDCFSPRTLSTGAILGLLAWAAEGLAFAYILHLLGADMPIATAVFIYAFSMLVGAITFLPGGLGGTEVTMLQLLILYQMPAADAVVAILLIRLATLWFAVALGLIALPFAKGRAKEA